MTAIDISAWQGHPYFAAVKAAGVSLVIMKCGGGEGGRLYTDSVYLANRAAARAQGLSVGSYFFNGPVDPTAAADYQWSIIDWRPGDIVAIDVETATGLIRWTPAQVFAWVNRIRSHGVPASQIVVYMSSSVTQLRVTPKALPGSAWLDVVATGVGLWVAQYGSNNGTPQGAPSIAGWSSWALWQYTSAKSWPGIAGNVDTSQVADAWAGEIGSVVTDTPPAAINHLPEYGGADVALVMNRSTDNVIAIYDESHWQEFDYTSDSQPSADVKAYQLDFAMGQAHALPNVPYDAYAWNLRSNLLPALKRPLFTDTGTAIVAIDPTVASLTDAQVQSIAAAIPAGVTEAQVVSAVTEGANAVIAKIPTDFTAK